MKVSPHLDKIGILGSTFAALCCLGVPAVISLVSAVGLGFLINDAILGPLLVVFLLVTLWGLWSGWRRHGRLGPLALGSVAGIALFVFAFLAPSGLLAGLSIAGLVAASVLNVLAARPARL